MWFGAPPTISILGIPSFLQIIHRISRLPLLIFDMVYHILAHAAPSYTNSEPNLESGANIDCCKLYRDNKAVSVISVTPCVLFWPVSRASFFF